MTEPDPNTIKAPTLDLSLDEPGTEELVIEQVSHDQKVRKNLAFYVLTYIGIFIFAVCYFYFNSGSTPEDKLRIAKEIFTFAGSLLPLGTLILGYYFASQ